MTETAHRFLAPDFLALTVGIVVYFVGVLVVQRVRFLRVYNIPEPVVGGFIAALVIWGIYLVFSLEIDFDLSTRDRLLVIFFAAVGLNARLADLAAGGRVLAILCAVTVAYVFVQNGVGALGAQFFGLPAAAGVTMGSVALVGGHGTAIAWGPVIAGEHGFAAAVETGVAVATLGLIVASLLGGPIAKFLIERRGLAPASVATPEVTTPLPPEADAAPIDKMGVMRALLAVNVAVILGYLVHQGLSSVSTIKLPLFVPCMLMGIVLSNTVPLAFPRIPWPARTASLDLISSYALSVFLAMSLMSMQLWTLAEVAGPLLVVVGLQALVAVAYIIFLVFPALGRDYQAAVLSGGFTGLSLGATPTAIANMTAITKHYGPSPNVFIILPLVSAFFVDLVNVGAITFFLSR
jgi:ESS family glutamate:Na+ symporter